MTLSNKYKCDKMFNIEKMVDNNTVMLPVLNVVSPTVATKGP